MMASSLAQDKDRWPSLTMQEVSFVCHIDLGTLLTLS